MDRETRMTQANEDYLEAVYELAGDAGDAVRSVDLADKLGVSKASVNKAVSVLKSYGYVTQKPYGDVMITKEGLEYGRSIHLKHLVLSHFLKDAIGVNEQTAGEEACMMERAISDETLKKWIRYMKKNHPESVKAALAGAE